MGTIRMKGEDRREAIVRSAIRLFAEKGFRGATTRELAAAVGVTEPVLYQHFQTKRDLYTAILETNAAKGARHSRAVLELAAGDDDERFLGAVGNAILQFYEEEPELIRLLLFSSLEGHELSDLFFTRVGMGFFDLVTRYLERRMKAGALRRGDAQIIARALIGVFANQGLMRTLHPKRIRKASRRKLVDEIVSVFLYGLRGCPEA